MKVIEPSYEWIEDELEGLTLEQRIERCGRLCYKSEGKITDDSAEAFVQKVRDRGHNSVLEMAVVGVVTYTYWECVEWFLNTTPRFLHLSHSKSPDDEDAALVVSGSIRAFREQYIRCPEDDISQAIAYEILKRWPIFFEDIRDNIPTNPGPLFSLDNPDKYGGETFMKHNYIAIKFTVNRAVSHELVRHRPCSFLQESQRYCRYGNDVVFIQPWWFNNSESEPKSDWLSCMESCEEIYHSMLASGLSPQAARTVLPNSCKTEIIVYCNLQEWHHILTLRTSSGADPSMREVMVPLLKEFQVRFPGMFDEIIPA